jgi:pimeloyl-ACP methyl ester carboxylesterase
MTTWVFLRGLIREKRHWGSFPAVFQQEFSDAHVVTLDLPGNGSRYREPSPTSVEEMAQFCRSELARLNLPPPYCLLTLSLGAMVAVAWCMQHPEEVDACVLINTSLRPFNPFYRRLRPHNYLKLIGSLYGTSAQRERLILELTSCDAEKHNAVLDDWITFHNEFPVSRRNALRQLIAAMRFRAPLTKPHPSILVLGSIHDRLVDGRCSRQLVQQWQADFSFHPRAGHDLPLDDGPWIARAVKEWLASGKLQPFLNEIGDAAVIIGKPKLARKQ